jgi:hypothetical protein
MEFALFIARANFIWNIRKCKPLEIVGTLRFVPSPSAPSLSFALLRDCTLGIALSFFSALQTFAQFRARHPDLLLFLSPGALRPNFPMDFPFFPLRLLSLPLKFPALPPQTSQGQYLILRACALLTRLPLPRFPRYRRSPRVPPLPPCKRH